jgi:hypothetical protein
MASSIFRSTSACDCRAAPLFSVTTLRVITREVQPHDAIDERGDTLAEFRRASLRFSASGRDRKQQPRRADRRQPQCDAPCRPARAERRLPAADTLIDGLRKLECPSKPRARGRRYSRSLAGASAIAGWVQ